LYKIAAIKQISSIGRDDIR